MPVLQITYRRNIMQNIKKSGLALAAMALMAASSVSFAADKPENTKTCIGANACKGQSSCKTAQNACKGENACKGHGRLELSEAECAKAGGKVAK